MNLRKVFKENQEDIARGNVDVIIYKIDKSWDYQAYEYDGENPFIDEMREILKILDENAIVVNGKENPVLICGVKKGAALIKSMYENGVSKLSTYLDKAEETAENTEEIAENTGLQVFSNSEFGSVRTVIINGLPYFVGKDVAEILGYSNPQKAIRDHIDDEDKTVNNSFTVNGTKGILINESGLYSLILSSKLPKAKEFKHWVTSEVLPSIRKNGVYAAEKFLNDPDAWLAVLNKLKAEQSKVKELETQIKVIRNEKYPPDYMDLVFNHPEPITLEDIGKDYGYSIDTMNMWVKNLFPSIKSDQYITMGEELYKRSYIVSADDLNLWTQKGRLWLYQKMSRCGHRPIIERKQDN